MDKIQQELNQELLQQFFRGKSPEVTALLTEYQVCLKNALGNLVNGSAANREYNVGYYKGIKAIIEMAGAYSE